MRITKIQMNKNKKVEMRMEVEMKIQMQMEIIMKILILKRMNLIKKLLKIQIIKIINHKKKIRNLQKLEIPIINKKISRVRKIRNLIKVNKEKMKKRKKERFLNPISENHNYKIRSGKIFTMAILILLLKNRKLMMMNCNLTQ